MGFASRIFNQITYLIKGVQVFALIGRSGTGKSFRAMLLAKKFGISLIVDDGLLIKGQRIIAGKSAKREKLYLTAIKTALFSDPEHAAEVKTALSRQKFRSILLLGTSTGMVKKIARQLNLPHIQKFVNIQDIATEEEIKLAIKARRLEGKHTIPVPAIEIRRNFPFMIYETVKIFLKKTGFLPKRQEVLEKTVVRPSFNKRGALTISESAISQMVLHCVSEFAPALRIERVVLKHEIDGYRLELFIRVPAHIPLQDSLVKLQEFVIENIESYTGMRMNEVNIHISEVSKTLFAEMQHRVIR